MATAAQKRVNLVVSRIIPPVLLGAVVYATYALTKTLCSECLEPGKDLNCLVAYVKDLVHSSTLTSPADVNS